MADAWFPDCVARWYDAFAAEHHERHIRMLRGVRPREVDHWAAELLRDPHRFAAQLDRRIEANEPLERSIERYRALQASSEAFEQAGIIDVRDAPTTWRDIRQSWRRRGTLTKAEGGLLVPRRERPYPWLPPRRTRKLSDPASHFGGFLRMSDRSLREIEHVQVRVARDLVGRPEAWSNSLIVAVVPLVEQLDELNFARVDGPTGRRAYRVKPAEIVDWTARARGSLEQAAAAGAEIVLFPELCLTPSGQAELAQYIPQVVRRFGRPTLVVAGSAHTPCGSDDYHNRSLVYDASGNEVLQHNKLFRYEMSPREQGRYGLSDALGEVPREEDITTLPRTFEVLETAVGRIAVLICEDLSIFNSFGPIANDLEIDWLLVPIMDGAQTASRWTAEFGRRYALDGTSVLVGTCRALVEAHRAAERKARGDIADPGDGIALLIDSTASFQPEVKVLHCKVGAVATGTIGQVSDITY